MKQLYTLISILLFATTAFAQQISLTVEVPAGTSSVRFTGPWWGWDPNGGPEATDNGNNTWTVTMNPGTADMEYLWVVDGVQENLVSNAANGECTSRIDAGTLITDYSAWANRVHKLNSGSVTDDTYGSCTYSTLSFSNLSPSNVNFYPNPVQNTLNVSAAVTVDEVSIFDLTGRQVLRATPNAAAFTLDVADLNKGMYLVSLKSGDQEMTAKLVK